MYHRFGEGYTEAGTFEKQIRYLKNHFFLLDLESYVERITNGDPPPPASVLLSVDDGYRDFYEVAFPILRKHGVPAAVFLTLDFVDKGVWLWHDRINFGIGESSRPDIVLAGERFHLVDPRERRRLKHALDEMATRVNPQTRDELISDVLKELRVEVPERPPERYAPLNWEEIRHMSRYGISFGGHTCTHPVLSRISRSECIREVGESKKGIEEALQRSVLAFCYPNGKEGDFDEETKEVVRESGYLCAMSAIYGMNDSQSDRYALRRMSSDGPSFVQFQHDVCGVGVLRRFVMRD
jgi:peptidoglycan/xylan/chitin deacetylase (PgdA/CDA1 family)